MGTLGYFFFLRGQHYRYEGIGVVIAASLEGRHVLNLVGTHGCSDLTALQPCCQVTVKSAYSKQCCLLYASGTVSVCLFLKSLCPLIDVAALFY